MRKILDVVTAVVWDLNGTLQDDLWLSYMAVERIFKHCGIIPPTLGEYRRWISTDFRTFYEKYGISKSVSREILTEIRRQVFKEYWDTPILRPDAHAVMGWLWSRDVKLSIVSGEDKPVFSERMSQHGFDDNNYIFPRLGGVNNKEEDLRRVVYTLNLESCPSKIFYVDDSRDGIEAAKRCGIRTFGMKNGYAFPEVIENAQPDYAIERLSEIIEIFKGLVNS